MRKRKPIYLEIKARLKSEIFGFKHQMLSESQLVQRFRVSNATARRVLDELENDGLVVRQIGKGTMVRQPAKRAMRELAVVFFDFLTPHEYSVAEILRGLETAIAGRNYNLHILTTRGRRIADDPHLPLNCLVARRKLDGVFVLSPLAVEDLQYFQNERLPCVSLCNSYPGLNVPAVLFDYAGSIAAAGRYFRARGLRKIGVLARQNNQPTVLRACDFIRSAVREIGRGPDLEFDPRRFVTVAHEESAGAQGMRQFFALPPADRPDALFVSGPAICKGAQSFLDTHPKWQPCMVCFSDRPGMYPHAITYSYFDMGCEGWRLMEQLLHDPDANPPSVYLPMTVEFAPAAVGAAAG